MNTIAAYSSHFGEEDMAMEMEWYKEAGAQMRVVVLVHYSMGHAIQDMRVGHSHD